MLKGRDNNAKIKREEAELDVLLTMLPDNPLPWASVLGIVGPIVARLAVRYALKKLARGLAEEKVNAIGTAVADKIAGIIAKRTAKVGGIDHGNG